MKALERPLTILLLLVLATAILLHGNLFGPFFSVDDHRYVCFAVAGPWTKVFQPQRGMFYAPLTYLSFRLDRALFGPAQEDVERSFGPPWTDSQSRLGPGLGSVTVRPVPIRSWAYGPRLMNGVYHLLAGFFLWLFLSRLGAGSGTAAFVALAWAVHPLALESVAWVCERKNTLCAMFGFASLAAWTIPWGGLPTRPGDSANRPTFPWRLPLVWLLFAAALLSKVAALSFLPLFVVLEYAALRQEGFTWRDGRQWLGALERLSGQLILSGLAAWIGSRVFEYEIAIPPGGSVWTGLLTDSSIFWRYTRNLLLPLDLSFFYGVDPVRSLGDTRLWLCGGALALLWGALLWLAGPPLTLPSPQGGEGGVRGRLLAVIGFVWFFGGLGPNANIVGSAFPMQDRYLYFPGPGLLLALALGLKGLAERTAALRRALPCGGAAYVALLAVLCAVRSPLFGDSEKLELDAARRQPDSGMARWCVAGILRVRFLDHANSSDENERRQGTRDAEKLICELQAVLACQDACDFTDPLTVRVYMAEALLYLDKDAEARAAIAAALPPPGPLPAWRETGRLFRDLPETRRQRVKSTYLQQSVAKAYLLLGHISLRQSAAAATAEARISCARDAVLRADQSLAVHPLQDEALLLKGKALIRAAYLLADDGAMAEARKEYEAAKTILSNLAASSPQADAARRILDNVPPPVPGLRP